MKYRYYTIVLLAVFNCLYAKSQTAEEIVERYISEIGGKQLLNSITSGLFHGTASLSADFTGGTRIVQPYDLYFKKPKVLLVTYLPATDSIFEKRCYDGNAGWMIHMGLKEIKVLNKKETDDMKNSLNDFGEELINWKETGCSLELLASEKIGTNETYVIKLTDKSGQSTSYYFDKVTYMILKKRNLRSVNGAAVIAETNYEKFTSVKGYVLPFTFSTKVILSDGKEIPVLFTNIERVSFDIVVDDDLFLQPKPRLTQADPNMQADELFNKAKSEYKLAEYDAAITDFTSALNLKPEFANAYLYRGFSEYLIGKLSDACTDWNKAKELGQPEAQLSIDKYCK